MTQPSEQSKYTERLGRTGRSVRTRDIRRSARTERDASIALLYNAGISATRLAAISGLSDTWIRQIANRYNAQFDQPSEETTNEPTSNGDPLPS